MSLSKGDILKGQYQIKDILGSGGQGSVYHAFDMKKGYFERAEVAIKEMRRGANLVADMVNIDFYRQEVKILAGLRHPYLPRIFDAFSEGGSYYIVEEYIEGQTMEAYLRKEKKLPPLKAVDLSLRIADILDFLHQQDPPIYYRDLKPANLLMQPGRLYLVDFSGCYIPMMGFNEGVAVRTRGYCPPEAYTSSTADAAFDVYTLGMLLYQMVTGDNVNNFTSTPPPINPIKENVPKELAMIINKAIKKNKMSRYHTIWEMKLELEQVEKQLRELKNTLKDKKEEDIYYPLKTPLKYIILNHSKALLITLMDILVFLMLPAIVIRPIFAAYLPMAESGTSLGWFFYLIFIFILIVHLSFRHWIDFFEPAARLFRYLHFPVRNVFSARPIRWLLTLELIFIFYVYYKILWS